MKKISTFNLLKKMLPLVLLGAMFSFSSFGQNRNIPDFSQYKSCQEIGSLVCGNDEYADFLSDSYLSLITLLATNKEDSLIVGAKTYGAILCIVKNQDERNNEVITITRNQVNKFALKNKTVVQCLAPMKILNNYIKK